MITKLAGYVTNKEFNEKLIPVPYQNMILRNYCNDNNYDYILPYGELIFKNNFSQLTTLISTLDKNTAIICCSIYMLPNNTLLKSILKKINNKKTFIYFIYEDIYLSKKKDLENINLNFNLKKISDSLNSFKVIKTLFN